MQKVGVSDVLVLGGNSDYLCIGLFSPSYDMGPTGLLGRYGGNGRRVYGIEQRIWTSARPFPLT